MKLKIFLFFFIIIISISCDKKNKKEKTPPPQKVKVYQLKTENVPIIKDFVGQVYGEKDIPIRARVEGFLEKIHFTEGAKVKKGQLLYSLDPNSFQEAVAAQQSLVSQSNTMLSQSTSDLSRIKPLADMNAVSKRDLDMAQAKKDASRSSVNAANANLNIARINLSYTKIRSPIDGIIGKTIAREGEFVGRNPNPVILNTVSNIKSIRVQFFLSESEYLKFMEKVLRTGELEKMKKQNNLELILTDDIVHKYKGHVDFIDRNIDPSTGTILIQATFPNPEGLIRPGQYTKVRALIDDKGEAILVPQQSTREIQGKNFVYVVNDNNIVENRHIEILKPHKDFFIIKKGLKSGEKIILENVQKIRSKMTVVPEMVSYVSKVDSLN